jgi:DNA polymerase elongation subunit (family B)
MSDLKILVWDIETTPIEYRGFGLWNQNINYKSITRDWSIICASWKELGKDKIYNTSILKNKKPKNRLEFLDDYQVTLDLRNAVQEADILIAHNGDRFDLKKLNARIMLHGIEPISHNIVTIDTLKEIRKVAAHTSNRLDYLGDIFGTGVKMEHSKNLWNMVMEADRDAVQEMSDYCDQDVRALEDFYLRVRPYFKSHPNIAEANTHNCPKCNSSNVKKNGVRMNRNGSRRQEYKCNSCGSHFSQRKAIPDAAPLSKV